MRVGQHKTGVSDALHIPLRTCLRLSYRSSSSPAAFLGCHISISLSAHSMVIYASLPPETSLVSIASVSVYLLLAFFETRFFFCFISIRCQSLSLVAVQENLVNQSNPPYRYYVVFTIGLTPTTPPPPTISCVINWLRGTPCAAACTTGTPSIHVRHMDNGVTTPKRRPS